jgi:hypothetical protein
MAMIRTPAEISALLASLRPRVTAYRWSVHRRAVMAYQRAFGREARRGDTLSGCVIHNAIVDRDRGRPWPEIDYHHLRHARFLLCRQGDAERLIDRLYARLVNDWRQAGCPQSPINCQ